MYVPDLFAVLPEDRASRWHRLAAFVEAWHGALSPEHGTPSEELDVAEARLGLPLPAALREAYARFGQRDEITIAFDTLLAPAALRREQGMLVFWSCDDVIMWGVPEEDLTLADPPVVVREPHGRGASQVHAALRGEASVSRFFVWKALEQALSASRYKNTAVIDAGAVPEIARRFTALDFGLVPNPEPGTCIYGGRDALLALMSPDELTLVAPSLIAYRKAVAALDGLGVPWQMSEAEAHNGEFHEHKRAMLAMEAMLHAYAPAIWPGPPDGDVSGEAAERTEQKGQGAPDNHGSDCGSKG